MVTKFITHTAPPPLTSNPGCATEKVAGLSISVYTESDANNWDKLTYCYLLILIHCTEKYGQSMSKIIAKSAHMTLHVIVSYISPLDKKRQSR